MVFKCTLQHRHPQLSLQIEFLSLFVVPGAFTFFCELCEYLNDIYYDLLSFPNGFIHSSLELLVTHSAEHRRPHIPSSVTWDLLPSPAWSQQGCSTSSRGHSFALAAAAAKLLQSCPTLCDPIDGSPPGSPVPGILQARTLEWVSISSSNVWKWKVKVKSPSRVRLFATPWTAAHQAPPSMGFSRQEYWSGVPYWTLFRELASGLRSSEHCLASETLSGCSKAPAVGSGLRDRPLLFSSQGSPASAHPCHLLLPPLTQVSSAFSVSTCTSGSNLSSLFLLFHCAPSSSRAHSICTGSELQEVRPSTDNLKKVLCAILIFVCH